MSPWICLGITWHGKRLQNCWNVQTVWCFYRPLYNRGDSFGLSEYQTFAGSLRPCIQLDTVLADWNPFLKQLPLQVILRRHRPPPDHIQQALSGSRWEWFCKQVEPDLNFNSCRHLALAYMFGEWECLGQSFRGAALFCVYAWAR